VQPECWHAEQVAAEEPQLRATFNAVAELYDRVRPTYPSRLITDLVCLCGLGPHSRVLEIGPGTGQLTPALAAHGCSIEAVELGLDLAVIARANLASFPRVHVSIAAFEQWPRPPDPFDIAVAATSFHWIDPQIRVAKSAAALRPGGALATIATRHVAGGTADFFAEVQTCYRRWDPSTPADLQLPTPKNIEFDRETDGFNEFEPAIFRRYEQEVEYSTSTYADILRTYSATQVLPPSVREGLLDCITTLINQRYDGIVVKRYLFELRVARRRS
jgi:SAM-dependent methyltransferase